MNTTEADYESIFENALDAVLLTAPTGEIYYANPAACALFGYTLEELRAVGRSGVVDGGNPKVREAIEERQKTGRFSGTLPMKRKDGTAFSAQLSSAVFATSSGEQRTSMFVRDLADSERREEDLRAANADLARALAEVDRLRGILPICSYCKKVRDGRDYWLQVEEYISTRSSVQFSHSICPSCYDRNFAGRAK